MSNYSSVILTWSAIGDETRHKEEATIRKRYTEYLQNIAKELGGERTGHLDVVAWGCGFNDENGEGDTMVCENVARLTVNHLNPDEIWEAIEKHAKPLMNLPEQETEVFYKSENMDHYERVGPDNQNYILLMHRKVKQVLINDFPQPELEDRICGVFNSRHAALAGWKEITTKTTLKGPILFGNVKVKGLEESYFAFVNIKMNNTDLVTAHLVPVKT